MRKIEFRGIAKDGPMKGRFVYGDLIHTEDRVFIVNHEDQDSPYDSMTGLKRSDWVCQIGENMLIEYSFYAVEVIPETVGKFTGKLGNNKNPIYEGDIIRSSKGFVYVVEWSNIASAFGVRRKGSCLEFLFDLSEMEIIGNIHQNKELLR